MIPQSYRYRKRRSSLLSTTAISVTNIHNSTLSINPSKKRPQKRITYKHTKRRKSSHFLLFLLVFFLLLMHPITIHSQETDNFCGTSWIEAANSCTQPCPSSTDSDCTTPGHTCYPFTGCLAKLSITETPSTSPTELPTASPTITAQPTIPPPTGTPTYTPSGSPSSSPSGIPTAAPIVNWYPNLDTTSTMTNGGGIMFVEDDPSLRSFGCIFEVESAVNSPAIKIMSLEVYISYDDELFINDNNGGDVDVTNAKAVIGYELWTRPKTWHGFEGRARAFQKIAMGNVTITNGQLNHRGEKLIPLTIDNFDPIKMDGDGLDRRALYVTLNKRNLLYQRSSEPLETESISSIEEVELTAVEEDTILLAATDHLIVYEGAAVMKYPFKEAKQSIFYRMPRGFVGRILYDRDPCQYIPLIDENGTDTGMLTSVTRWEDCNAGETKAPRPTLEPTVWVKPRWTLAPATGVPTDAPVLIPEEDEPTTSPVWSPTGVPSISVRPSVYIMKSYLILTFDNIRLDRVMDAREQNSFEKKIVSFLNEKQAVKTNEVDIQGAKVWYQQTYTVEEREQMLLGKVRPRGNKNDADGGGRSLQQVENSLDGFSDSSVLSIGQFGGMDLIVPTTPPPAPPTLEVTITFFIESSPLPQRITSQLLETMIRNSKMEFLADLKEIDALYDLFATTNDVPSVLSVEQITKAPTRRPTRAPVVPVVEEEEPPGMFSSPLAIFLLILGLSWVGLVLVSFAKIKKARRLMRIVNARRFLGEDSFVTPHHGMFYDEEIKDDEVLNVSSRSKKKGMKTSLLSGFGGGGKKNKKKKLLVQKQSTKNTYKDHEYSDDDDEDYSEGSEEDMSSMEDSYSSGESLSEESSGSY